MGDENGDGDGDGDMQSDRSSDLKPWGGHGVVGVGGAGEFGKAEFGKGGGGILKTTNVQITTAKANSDGATNRSSQEVLIR